MAATAFLQAEWRAWVGLVTAAALFVGALLSLVLMPSDVQTGALDPAQAGVAGGLFLGALTIGLGSVIALVLRTRTSPGKIALVAGFGGWLLFQFLALAA